MRFVGGGSDAPPHIFGFHPRPFSLSEVEGHG